jgi:hypothetical protein
VSVAERATIVNPPRQTGVLRLVLLALGLALISSLVSNGLGAHYPTGPGREVAIWSNVDHVWIELAGRDWATADLNLPHGPGFGPQDAEGFVPSHPAGL